MAENEISPLLQKYKDLLVPNCMAAMDIAMTKVRDHARQNHRYRDKTGAVTKATREIPSTYEDDLVAGGIENTNVVGRYLHEGTKAHVIRPRLKKALHWETPGNVQSAEAGKGNFAKRVNHPGQQPDPFITRAVHENKELFIEYMAKAINRTLGQLK